MGAVFAVLVVAGGGVGAALFLKRKKLLDRQKHRPTGGQPEGKKKGPVDTNVAVVVNPLPGLPVPASGAPAPAVAWGPGGTGE